jgi:hypothetical protein
MAERARAKRRQRSPSRNVRFTPKSRHRLTREVGAKQALLFDFQSLACLSRNLAFAPKILVTANRLFNQCIFSERAI